MGLCTSAPRAIIFTTACYSQGLPPCRRQTTAGLWGLVARGMGKWAVQRGAGWGAHAQVLWGRDSLAVPQKMGRFLSDLSGA